MTRRKYYFEISVDDVVESKRLSLSAKKIAARDLPPVLFDTANFTALSVRFEVEVDDVAAAIPEYFERTRLRRSSTTDRYRRIDCDDAIVETRAETAFVCFLVLLVVVFLRTYLRCRRY